MHIIISVLEPFSIEVFYATYRQSASTEVTKQRCSPISMTGSSMCQDSRTILSGRAFKMWILQVYQITPRLHCSLPAVGPIIRIGRQPPAEHTSDACGRVVCMCLACVYEVPFDAGFGRILNLKRARQRGCRAAVSIAVFTADVTKTT